MNLDALLEPIPKRGAQPCLIQRHLNDLDEPYKSALQKLLDTRFTDGGMSDAELAQRMLQAGLKSSHTTVRIHRSGLCSCAGLE